MELLNDDQRVVMVEGCRLVAGQLADSAMTAALAGDLDGMKRAMMLLGEFYDLVARMARANGADRHVGLARLGPAGTAGRSGGR